MSVDHEGRSSKSVPDIVQEAGEESFPASDPPARTVVVGIADIDLTGASFRLRPIMKQGTASSIPETWMHYASVDDARHGAKHMYHNDRVLRVMMVDHAGSFVEWIER
jgi:hypothetical protein